MYERFTDRARKVIQLANQEAQRLNHEYIGTEHILLGLIKEGSEVAANVLKNLDIDLRKIRLEIEKIALPGPDMVTPGKLPQTPRAKKVIEYSIEEARNLNHNYIGTEHLLLGLLREQEGLAAQVLMILGLKLEDVRAEVMHILGFSRGPQPGRESILPRPSTPASEYDLYLPLSYNDGRPVEAEKIVRLKQRLRDEFGGLTFFPQRNEGIWKMGDVTFREEIVIVRFLGRDVERARRFLSGLKEELKTNLEQHDVLIVERSVRIL
jgi:hypothetical protein